MKNLMALIAAASMMIASAAGASDFSGMAKPAFARSLLLSPERQMEVNCAAIAYLPFREVEVIDVLEEMPPEEPMTDPDQPEPETIPDIEFEKPLAEEQALLLRAAVLARLQSDIGEEETAQETFEMRAGVFAPTWDFSPEAIAIIAKSRATVSAKCIPIFEAVASGRLDAALSPPSASPIALPDVDTCLAYDLIGRTSQYYTYYDYLHQEGDRKTLYEQLLGGRGKKRTAKEAKIASLAASLTVITPDTAALRLMPCMATFVAALR